MEMNIGDMVAAMAARNEAFRGNEQVPEKVETYNKLKEHAAAIGKVLRAPWTIWNCGSRTPSSISTSLSRSTF